MIDTLNYITAQISLGTSMWFWGMYIVTAIIVALIITGGLFKDD